MNDKETKVPIYIAIIVALILVAAAGYYVLGKPTQTNAQTPTETPAPARTEGPATTVASPASTSTTASAPGTPQASPATTIKCELCHTNSQDLSPHVNGGRLCINCHGSQVHNIHIGEGTVNLDCKTCHGFPPVIPTVQKGTGPGSYSICEQCHAPPPDNTKPSNGNLILIHLSRGKYCTNCHGTDITSIHAAALSNESRSTAPAISPTPAMSPTPTNAST